MMRNIRLLPLVFMCFLILSCSHRKTLFHELPSSQTGLEFNNLIKETDSINVIELENVYNGGGIAVGDFNNDGLQDLFFTGNLVECKLYLNKGKLRFEDVTAISGTTGSGKWCRGVATVDINNDGLLDLYVGVTLERNPEKRKNLLYVNQGPDKEGIPVFKELAEEYGLADTTYTTMPAFLDYDNDGDLDCYIAVNDIVKGDYPNRFRNIKNDGTHSSTDKLYRNDWNDSLKHPFFTDVSKQAGILWEGYSHGVNICDINQDGWKDIYVSNDYLSGNLLYVNNRNGTFTNREQEYFKHGAANAMGNDLIDINNDGLSDLVELDMNPEDNYRKKMMMNPNSYQTFQNIEYFGYPYQYVRNVLQVNMGPTLLQNDSLGEPVFSDLAYFSGIAETDWSWTPSVADFDNDGFRDIVISNGFPKDVTDHDFIAYRNESYLVASEKDLLEQIPEVKIRNYAFRNDGNLHFSNVSDEWGIRKPTFSNGAVYADLDNDGDLEYITNNINDEASVYENTLNQEHQVKGSYLEIKITGPALNRRGLGAWVELYKTNGERQVIENSPYRGYLSSVDDILHFGLGDSARIDSLVIKWPDGKKQSIPGPGINQLLEVNYKDADQTYSWNLDQKLANSLFSEITQSLNIHYTHQEKDFIDFNIQKLLPHKLSQYGPALAAGDINGDGLDDIVIGGSKAYSTTILFQQPSGKFREYKLLIERDAMSKMNEDMGILLFDADNDGDLDLYCASGSYENLPNTVDHRDGFFRNDGKGNLKMDTTVFPLNYTSKSCLKAADYDGDGDLDLFLGGRVMPGSWPKPVSSFIYRNDSQNGNIKFTDVTSTVAKSLINAGLVCDALWTDFDNDGQTDLLVAGEFMPLTFLHNRNGIFENITAGTGLADQAGWWNSLAGGDFDNDGDIDYIAGNLGLNSFYKASAQYPVKVYAGDFDKDGRYDAIPSIFIKDKADGKIGEFPTHTRDDLVKQMIEFRKKYPGYKAFAQSTMDQILTTEEKKDALVLQASYFRSAFVRNLGNGKFRIEPLPDQAQWSPLDGMLTDDFDHDGNLDILLTGNDYGTDVSVGRYDAMNGLLMKGDGKGNFQPLSIAQSGIFIPGDAKALIKLTGAGNKYLVVASQNKGLLKAFSNNQNTRLIPLQPGDLFIEWHLKNGNKRKEEIYNGNSFLSQSSRFISVDSMVQKIIIHNGKGNKREMTF